MLTPLLLACAGPGDGPTDTDRVDPPDPSAPEIGVVERPPATFPAVPGAPAVVLGDVAHWSFGSPVAEHHANVAFRPDGTVGLAWTWREYGPNSKAFVRVLAGDGTPTDAPIALADGRYVAKPDLVSDELGRLFVTWESMESEEIGLERVDPASGAIEGVVISQDPLATAGNNSVELGRTAAGDLVAVWNVAELPAPKALYWSVSVTPELEAGEPFEIARIDNFGVSSPPDLAPVPGGYAVAWADLREVAGDQPDSTVMLSLVSGGAVSGTVPGYENPDTFVARPSITADPAGRMAVACPEQAGSPVPAPVRLSVAFYDAAGAPLREPFQPVPGVGDQAVVEFLDDAHVALVWAEVLSAALVDTGVDLERQWGVYLAVLRFPSGEFAVEPTLLSASDASATRPSVAVRQASEREYQLAIAWEQTSDAEPLRQVHGRMAWITF